MKQKLDIRFPKKYIPQLRLFNTDTVLKLDFTRTVKALIRASVSGESFRIPIHDTIAEAAENRDCPLCYTVPLNDEDEDIIKFFSSIPQGFHGKTIGAMLETAFTTIQKKETKHSREEYAACGIDSRQPHGLDEDFEHTRPAAFTFKECRVACGSWKELLPSTCEVLAKNNPEAFQNIIAHGKKGRGDNYYLCLHIAPKASKTQSREKMRPLMNAKGYVNCTLGAKQATQIVRELLLEMGYSSDDMQMYIQRDYRKLEKCAPDE